MTGPKIVACVFDAYGTLFDVAAAARDLAARRPDDAAFAAAWPALAETWRSKQLEYTWLRAITGSHRDFETVTADALDFALDAHELDPAALAAPLMALYRELGAYPEVRSALEALKADGRALAILSNGSPAMLDAAVAAAGLGELLPAENLLSVESVGVFKPHDSVYALATTRFDCAREAILFVSSNGWDVCSAAAYGFRTAWVNRRSAPVDRLDATPDRIVPTLSDLAAVAHALEGRA
jgi:2-haloacid dehalogenase